jgi:elongation factor P
MSMVSVTDLRAGTVFEENGQLLQVVSYEHIKMGRGSANIKVKIKNLATGSNLEKSFINGAKVNEVSLQKRELQYLYSDDDNAYFMNPQTYEQTGVPLKFIDTTQYLKEGDSFQISFRGEEPLSVMFPPKMTFTVADTPPGAKGNSVSNVFKEATLDNGLVTKVPMFISIGDKIRVDTRTGIYSEKATS